MQCKDWWSCESERANEKEGAHRRRQIEKWAPSLSGHASKETDGEMGTSEESDAHMGSLQ
eukprot:3047968-Pleurochrysis_carterae.AAC.1